MTGWPSRSCNPRFPCGPRWRNESREAKKNNMAAGSSPSSSSSNSDTSQQVDRIALLYPKVNESETPLPRSWSPKDKFTFIGLSQNNLRVHYKG